MNWLLDNPIAEMPGPLFLALYAGLIVLIFGEAIFRSRRANRSRELGPMPVPTKPDPHEIAYLRGGENEVTRLIVFDLIRRDYLRVQESKEPGARKAEFWIEHSPDHPEVERLSPVEAIAFDEFATRRKPETLFPRSGLSSKIKPWLEPLAESLRDRQLLHGPDRYSAAWRTWWGGAIMILAVGGFKMAVALSRGRYNIAFLVVFAVISLGILGIICAVPRVTGRGKDYLVRLREAFEGLRTKVIAAQQSASVDPALILVPAVFGVAALAGTSYAYVPDLFRSSARSSGGCGGGCGSSGGGCGGGGGGCGGGCGGCGGD